MAIEAEIWVPHFRKESCKGNTEKTFADTKVNSQELE